MIISSDIVSEAAAVQAIFSLMMPRASVAVVPVWPSKEHRLQSLELSIIRKACANRRAQFAAGRLAAAIALDKLNLNSVAIPTGENREPVWPPHIVGSITHTADLAAAITVIETDYRGIGIDLEPEIAINVEIEPIVMTAFEQAARSSEVPRAAWLALHFSAKESVYKALAPCLGYTFDFLDIQLCVAGDRFVASPAVGTALPPEIRAVGRFSRLAGHILTCAWLSHDFAQPG